MINFSIHYPYDFDVINAGDFEEGDFTIALESGDYVFNVKPLRRGIELIQSNSKISFAFKTGENIGGHHYVARRPSSDGLMPREFFKPFEFAFSYDSVAGDFTSYKKLLGQSEKDVIEYKKINIFNEATSPPNTRVFSWNGNLYLIGTAVGSSFAGTVPCVNLYRWNNSSEGFEKIHVFYADSIGYVHESCDYVIHNDDLFITFFSDVNKITCYKAKDLLASSWEKVSTTEIPLNAECWSSPEFRYRIRAASDSFAVNIVAMFGWRRDYEDKSYQEAEFIQLISLDNCLSFSYGNDSSNFLINSSYLGETYQRQNKNVLGLFTVVRSASPPENLAPFNVNFDMYYEKKIGTFVIMKSGEGDDVDIDNIYIPQQISHRLPNKCYLVGIKNLNGNYFIWESCLKLPLDYNISVPDLSNYNQTWSPVFEERFEDANSLYYKEGILIGAVIPAHARAIVLQDLCVVPGDALNDLIIAGRNLKNAYGGAIDTEGSGGIDREPFTDPYADTKVIFNLEDNEIFIDNDGFYVVNERSSEVLATEFCFLPQDVVVPGVYQDKIYSYGGKFHNEYAFICGPMMFETSSIFPKGFRAYGRLNGDPWYNPMACRWNGSLIASAAYGYSNNYTFFSVLGPISNVGEKYGYQHNYCPYVRMFHFGWREYEIGDNAEITFSRPAAHFEYQRGYQRFKISNAEEAAYCYLRDTIMRESELAFPNLIDETIKRYCTPLGRIVDGKFKIRLKFSLNVDTSQEDVPNVCVCMVKIGGEKYSIHLLKEGSGVSATKRIAMKYQGSLGTSFSRSVNIESLDIYDPGNLESYIEVMFGNGIGRKDDDTGVQFMWVRVGESNWIESGNLVINPSIEHPDLDPVELTNGLWVGLLSANSIASLSEGDEMEMRVRQVAVSSYGYQYRPSYSDSFRRLNIDGEGPSASFNEYDFEPIKSYSPYVTLPDGSELLLEPVTANESGSLFKTSAYEVRPALTRNSPLNVTNNISDSIYDSTNLYESNPDFEIIFKSKDGLPVDCLSLINMVGFFAFDLASGDYNEVNGTWANKQTETYVIPYTKHNVEDVDGKTILLEYDASYEYQRDQLVGHSLIVYDLETNYPRHHRIITSNFDRVIIVNSAVEIQEGEGVRILKRNGSFDVTENIGASSKNYFSISFISTDDAPLRAIGEIVFGKWIDLSDFHLTVSREKVKGFDNTASSMGLLFPNSTELNSGVKDSLKVSFTDLSRGNGDAEYCLNLFSDIYFLEKNFPILMDYEGKPSTEYVSLSGEVAYNPTEYNRSLDLILISQTPKSIPNSNSIRLNENYIVEIESFLGGNIIGFDTTTGSLNLRVVPVNFDEAGVLYVWSDGNGNTFTGSEITVSYEQRGQYNVSVRVYIGDREIASRNQTVYYVSPLTSYYTVGYLDVGSSHLIFITSKDQDGNTVNDSTTTVYLEGKNSLGQIIVRDQGVPLEGSLTLLVTEFPSTVIYEVRDQNGATGFVTVT
jgi:hypothetical protein